ncbi:MAG: AsmA family protein, partial [Deltaproteobacteria bacterium]
AKAGKLTGVHFKSADSLSMTGQFLTDEKFYRLSGLHLSTGKLDAQGDVAFQPQPSGADKPRVSGRLQIGELDISKMMLENKDPAQESADKSKPPAQAPANRNTAVKEKVFPSQPLPFDLLRSVDVDFELVLEKLTAPQWEMKDFSVKIDLENGFLRLSPVTASLGNGSLSGAVMLDAGKSPTELDINLRVQAATLRNLSGNINFLADLAGSGDSVAAIMAGLNGLVELDIKDLELQNSLMTEFAAGFFNFLNPLKKEKKSTKVICAVVLFKVVDGIADARRKIVAQMEDVTWLGGGKINLKTEEISLGISPRSRKLFDVDLGELASIGYLGGTLAQPKIEIDPKDIAIKYGMYTAAIFTGGLSVLADQLWRKFEANQDVCDRILQMVEAED